MTAPKLLRVLCLADTPARAAALAQEIAAASPGTVECTAAGSREDFFRRLRQPFDAVLSAVQPAGFAPFESIGAVAEAQPYLPVLCFGKGSVDEISEALKRGAMDFLEHLRDLPDRAREAIRKMRSRRSGDERAAALQTSETMFRALAEHALAGVYLIREVIFTSGYSDEIVHRQLNLQSGCNFLQKPYPPRALAEAVRNCLDGGVPPRGDTQFFKS